MTGEETLQLLEYLMPVCKVIVYAIAAAFAMFLVAAIGFFAELIVANHSNRYDSLYHVREKVK